MAAAGGPAVDHRCERVAAATLRRLVAYSSPAPRFPGGVRLGVDGRHRAHRRVARSRAPRARGGLAARGHADGHRVDEAGDPAADRRVRRAVAVAGRSDPRSRARAHPSSRLPRQPAADVCGNAALLSSRCLVALGAHPQPNASTAATSSRFPSAATRSATPRRSSSSRAGEPFTRLWLWRRPAAR